MKRVILYTIAALVVAFIGWRSYVMVHEVQTGPANSAYEMGVDVGKKYANDWGSSKMPSEAGLDEQASKAHRIRSGEGIDLPREPFFKGFKDGFVQQHNYLFKPAQ